ncbi:MAG: hypothetical protein IJ012_07590, partial [Clostridia bacterium]|nr:hypothetical protein [Clostridia bacterium]
MKVVANSYKRDGNAIPSDEKLYMEAYEEVVADAMVSMFADQNAYVKLAEFKKQDKTLWQKFGDVIKAILDKLKSLLGVYDGVSYESKEAEYVAQFSRDVYDKLQDLYIKAFVGAEENYQAAQKDGTAKKHQAKYCERNNNPNAFNPDGKTLKEQLKEAFNTAESKERRYVYVGEFTQGFIDKLKKHIDIKKLPIVMNYRDAYLSMEAKERGKYQGNGINYHNLGVDGLEAALLSFSDPDCVLLSEKVGKIELILQGKDYKNRQLFSIVAVNTQAQGNKQFLDVHVVTSVYGNRGLKNRIAAASEEGRVIYKKTEELAQGMPQVQYERDINANSSIDMIAQDPEIVNRKFSERDSQGNELSEEQQEFFKDSKVRDEKGNLLVVYHGTPNGAHNTFRSGSYFTPDAAYADKYQNPGASSLSAGKTVSNPKIYKVYLNITKPFDTRNATERKIFQNEYYRKYGTGAPLAESGLPDWTDGMDLQEFIEEMGYDYDGLILDEGGTGGYGDEVISRGLSYVTFSSEQVKNVDNKNPTSDPDIRYQERSTGAEQDPYSYEALVSKPDMKVTTVSSNVPNNRADVVAQAKKNAAKVGKTNPKDGSVSVRV